MKTRKTIEIAVEQTRNCIYQGFATTDVDLPAIASITYNYRLLVSEPLDLKKHVDTAMQLGNLLRYRLESKEITPEGEWVDLTPCKSEINKKLGEEIAGILSAQFPDCEFKTADTADGLKAMHVPTVIRLNVSTSEEFRLTDNSTELITDYTDGKSVRTYADVLKHVLTMDDPYSLGTKAKEAVIEILESFCPAEELTNPVTVDDSEHDSEKTKEIETRKFRRIAPRFDEELTDRILHVLNGEDNSYPFGIIFVRSEKPLYFKVRINPEKNVGTIARLFGKKDQPKDLGITVNK